MKANPRTQATVARLGVFSAFGGPLFFWFLAGKARAGWNDLSLADVLGCKVTPRRVGKPILLDVFRDDLFCLHQPLGNWEGNLFCHD